jgi:diguanylate cyclase (GGDEF)-like protein
MLAEQVLERIDTGILLLDSSMQIVKCNQALKNLADKACEEICGKPVAEVFPRFAETRYQQILRDCLKRGQVRFCSGMIHSAFILPEDPLRQYRCRQNLQVKRLEDDGQFYVLLQITDISDHFERVFHLKHLIRDLGADFEQARTQGESMRKQAYYDHLTGVYNRAMFMIQLRHDMKLADRNQKLVSVLFLDLDAFKSVNDTYGHAQGDLLLQQVAGRLKNCVRSSDTVARFGGDEFAIILTNITSSENVREVAEKIRQSLLATFELNGVNLAISASIGFSMYPADSQDPQALIDLADRAMYRVKFSGKNNVACYCDL